MREISNRVLRQDWVDWKDLEWIQGDLKELAPENLEKLINSILKKNIVKAFHVWENNGKLYCLDGNHLKKALEKIEKSKLARIPSKLRADFIKCDSMKEAKEMVLLYSAVYAKIIEDKLFDFLSTNELLENWNSLSDMIELPYLDMDSFNTGFLMDDGQLNFDINDDPEKSGQDRKNRCPKCGYVF